MNHTTFLVVVKL
jgi:hypothetical protein